MRLTGKDKKALDFIGVFCEVRGFSPTFREVGVAIGWESTQTVSHSLHKLRKAGLVEFQDGLPRTLRLTEKARAA